jgi:hypothetical protein
MFVLGLGIMVWATLPPSQIVLDDSCRPQGGPPTLSAALYPGLFWSGQLDALVAERNDLLAQPARRERIEAETAILAGGIETRMSRLSRDEADDLAEKERRAAETQSALLRRINWVMHCESEIRQRFPE